MAVAITVPTDASDIAALRAGDLVLLSGTLLTARDAAHKCLIDLLDQGLPLPIDLKNQAIYYTGPTPAPPGKVIGACGPTTSGRMDAYAPRLIDLGLKVMIGKGQRSPEVLEAIRRNQGVYLAATGGAGALIARCVQDCTVIAFPELGPEAIFRLIVKDLPLITAADALGNDLYAAGPAKYRL